MVHIAKAIIPTGGPFLGANLAPFIVRANVIQLSKADLDPLREMNSQRGQEWAFAGEDLR